LRIISLEWDSANIEHIARHGVTTEEVEEACDNRPFILKGRSGAYLIYSQTNAGRFILAIARHRYGGTFRVITARDMTENEKGLCKSRR
jgi:uncharacterized DUF497 family protein